MTGRRALGRVVSVDIGRFIREQVRQALETAKGSGGESSASSGTRVNIASAVNVDSSGHTVAVYSDDEVTVVERDGEAHVTHHRADEHGEDG